MKQEYDYATTEESYPHSPEAVSPLFKNNLSRFNLNNMRKEELLKFTLQEAESKLVAVQGQKRIICRTLKEKSDIILNCIQKNRKDIEKLENQIQKLESNSATMANTIKRHNKLKVDAFKAALKPLQDVIEMLETSKNEYDKKIESIDIKLKNLSKTETEILSNLEEKKLEENTITKQKEALIGALDEIAITHPWYYREYVTDKETKEVLIKIRDQKKHQIANLNEIDSIIDELTKQSTILAHDIDILKSQEISTESLSKNEIELTQLEEFLNLQCETFAGPKLSEIISELCTLGNFPINQMIFKEQFRIIEQKELEIIENAKYEQEYYEKLMIELSKNVEELEVENYALISVQQSDKNLEKKLKKSRKELEETRQKAECFMKDYNSKIQMIGKWKSENRNILLITDTARIPTDEQVVNEFYLKLKPFFSNSEHWRAMESVILRYVEKAKERDCIKELSVEGKMKDDGVIESKTELLKKIKAIRTTKESEKQQMQKCLENIILSEKKTLKSLENSKLESESAKKNYFKEQLQKTLSPRNNSSKNQKTYGEKAMKKINEKELAEVKNQFEKEKLEIKAKLETLYERKKNWDETLENLKKEITDNYQSKLKSVQQEKNLLSIEQEKCKKELNSLLEAENEANLKLNDLAKIKENELVKNAKSVAKKHGGEITSKIDKLYALHHKKESEICSFETELIKLEGGLHDKETIAELEIIKIKSRIQNIKDELFELEKAKKKTEKLEKTISKIDISQSDFISDIESSSEAMAIQKVPISFKRMESPEVEKVSSPEPNIYEEIKDQDEDNLESPQFTPKFNNISPRFEDYDNISDVSSEIPCPAEPNYKYDDSDAKYKPFFDCILPLLEGTIIYKLFKGKNLKTFDPLEGRVCIPEECGYAIRKMKISKQLGKLEIRNIGKAGVESSIIIDQIMAIVIPTITNDIIRARGKNNEEEQTLEKSEEYNKCYRNMKAMGSVDTESPAFVYKAKETNYFQFFITLKNGRVDFIAEGLSVYKTWLAGIKMLIKNKKDLERLKFKIIQI
ncbi:hypothetical protein SteCoe_16083 [Stentor coeruleus]|uniref:Uncharacterized protein n=1 Tax=Stentor coeruleus TaxID=5963 RepID=A0A1R2C1Z2_9CILI|nr:hypothetical protein SteCoe_16083 [Stentor coeruleus]